MRIASLSASLDPAAWREGARLPINQWPPSDSPSAEFVGGNIAAAPGVDLTPTAPAQLCFSGWLGTSPAHTSPGHWTPAAKQVLAAACATLASAPARVFLVPHHAHLLSDLPGCIAHVLAAREAAAAGYPAVGIALAPTALLAPSMLDHAMDHLERLIMTVAPLAPYVVMERVDHAQVDGAAIGALLRQHMGADSTLVLAGDAAELIHWLALPSP